MSAKSSQSPLPTPATFQDVLAIPEESRRHEVLDGELVEKEVSSGKHGVASCAAGGLFSPFRRAPNGPERPGGWWILVDVTIVLAPHQTVRPDLAGWRRERMPSPPEGYPQYLRPDWVCELSSDGDARRRDGIRKRHIYADHGIPHYWLVDLENETLTVLRLMSGGYQQILTAGRPDRVRAEPFDALELQIGVLFGDDGD